MRITQSMLSNNMLRHLMHSQTKMDTYLEQLYTGKKISRPSDDPVIAMKGINYRTQVAEVEQFKRNTGEVHNWMDNSDAALDKATQAMHRLSELAVQASNSTYGDEELNSIKEEALQLRDHLVDIANTKVNGKYIFNGTNTTEAPISFSEDGDRQINNHTTPVEIEVFKGTTIQANVDADRIFNDSFFENIDNFIVALDPTGEDDAEEVRVDESITAFDDNLSAIVDSRANLGARMNRLELIENRLEEQEVIATKTMADNENVHFEEAITNLITQETLHRAALAAGSRMMQPTLIDFLR